MKVFRGERGSVITVENGMRTYTLVPKGLFSDVFCWGRGRPCASETAVCILSDVLGYKKAMLLHTLFKWEIVVEKLKGRGWMIREDRIKDWAVKQIRHLRDKDFFIGEI